MLHFLSVVSVPWDLHFRGQKSENVKKNDVNGIFCNPILGHGFLMEKESLPQKIYPFPFSSHPPNPSRWCAPTSQLIQLSRWDIPSVHSSERIKFVAAPPDELNHYSVFSVLNARNSSCTGLAVFLACSLRSVGIPARVAGVPHWVKGEHEEKNSRVFTHFTYLLCLQF